jgi:DNA-directed RNA polymerase subunit RPC12/RpoP
MTKIYSARDPSDAHLVVAILDSHGIVAIVQGESLWAARGGLPVSPDSAPSVWVADDAAAERARRIIATEHGPANPTHCLNCGYDLRGLPEPRCPECGEPFTRIGATRPWTCPNCGERCEGQFTQCWKCGTERA